MLSAGGDLAVAHTAHLPEAAATSAAGIIGLVRPSVPNEPGNFADAAVRAVADRVPKRARVLEQPAQRLPLGPEGPSEQRGSELRPHGPADRPEAALDASVEQRPAAYRFGLRNGKIDVLPEPSEPEDGEFALDTYHELVAKGRELHNRLRGTNSALRVRSSVERLLTALGTQFDDVRPGVLLSRSRSLEADRAAFGEELPPDTIAMIDDAARTLRDLLASFPIVRRIEAERLALDLDRNADAVPIIREEMAAIKAASVQSGAVTAEAIFALTLNDDALEDANDPVVRTSLIADKLLVFRNFVSAVIGGIASYGSIAIAKARAGLGELTGKTWEEINKQLPKSIGATAALVPPFALVGLAVWLTDPVTGVAAAVATFKPMAQILKGLGRDAKPTKAKKQPKREKNP